MNQEDLYWFTFILVTLLGFFTYKLLTRHRSYFRMLRVPFEKPHFLYGNLDDVLSGKLTTMEKIEQFYRKFSSHGLFGFFNYMTPALYVRDPALIRQLLQPNMHHFESHGYFLDEEKDHFLGSQLHLVKGADKASKVASFVTPIFRNPNSLSSMDQTSQKCCTALVDFITSRVELELELKAIFLKHTLNIFAGIAFGKELNTFQDDTDRFCTVASGMAYGTNPTQVIKTMAFYLMPGLMRSAGVQFTDRQDIEYLVKQYHSAASTPGQNSIARSLSQVNDKSKTSLQLTDEQLTAQCATFFTKGFEPTLNLLSFAAYELAQNMDVQRKLYEELTHHGLTAKRSTGVPSYESIRSLPYLEAIVLETLRKWPPHPLLVRECTKPFLIPATENGDRAPIPLKVGDKLYLSVWALHRDEDFFPQPEQFDPERFVDANAQRVSTFIPFGIGRGCVGQEFVKLVVKVTLVALVQRFKLQPGERTAEPVKLIESASSLEARDGFWIRMEPRL
ncbi:probable cytochrome P450 9f2 [Anopheles marshallii]|uniref:probable cytochrome P450 9f2 n=1 Tax=Anopheles marshallii TaxID=1521116 RepID=UPI00237AAE80|nr:probable cytochrome P450 9f2 [Anopheles marshallii]